MVQTWTGYVWRQINQKQMKLSEPMFYDFLINEIEPVMRAANCDGQTGKRLDAMATSNEDEPTGRKGPVGAPRRDTKNVYTLSEVLAVLEKMDVLDNKKLCLQLVANLTERVGYQWAGYTDTINVAELMLMASRASDLADKLKEIDSN